MRTLSATLLAAQKQASSTPYVRVEASNRASGVVRLDWSRLYTGLEDDYHHAVTMPGDGSLVRVRVTPPADSRKLYRQRVASPGTGSDFGSWAYTGQYDALAVACCSLGAEVSIFWVKGDRSIYQLQSTDYGASWGSPGLIGYSASTSVYGLSAAYKPNGDIAFFLADQSTLYVLKRIGGSWGGRVGWDKSTGELSGVATAYSGDWELLACGQDTGGNYKLWSLLYGDGGEVSPGGWSALKELASAPSDGSFRYQGVFLDKPDAFRAFFVEKFTGTEARSTPFWSHTLPEAGFLSHLWREPVPFNLSSEYGVALAHHGDYAWLSSPSGVWRAPLAEQSLDLTADVLSLREELGRDSGRLVVELRNDDGKYAALGEGSLALLSPGAEISGSPGYRTTAGNEVSGGPAFILESYQHVSSGGKAGLVLEAADGWGLVRGWEARHQLRWNKDTSDYSVLDILALVLARAGLKLEVKSQSSVITGFYPDFTISPGNRGDAVVARLLSLVPDVLFVEGSQAYLVNPLSGDSPVYSYGGEHPILEGRYRSSGWGVNRVQVEGLSAGGSPVVVDSFAWGEVGRHYDRLKRVTDRNLDTVTKAQERGQAYLREAELGSSGGEIHMPPNCGAQLYDVVEITDSRAGLSAARRRVLGIDLTYDAGRGRYRQQLRLGRV